MKTKVVIIGVADWAGSAYQACKAINSVGEFECRAINSFAQKFEHDGDILIPLYPQLTKKEFDASQVLVESIRSPQYKQAAELLEVADIIHLWNTNPIEVGFVCNALPINYSKVKIATWTGTAYRERHKEINALSKSMGLYKTTVQNPCLKFPGEIDSVFIPHAIDVDSMQPSSERNKWIGTYRPVHGNVPNVATEIETCVTLLRDFPDWSVELDYSMPHAERLSKLSKCAIFMQDLNPHIGYWGRSTLEACAFGVPSIQNWTERALQNSEGKLGNIPIISTNQDGIKKTLTAFIQDKKYREEIGQKCRDWVKAHFSYPVIGRMYSDLYQSVL